MIRQASVEASRQRPETLDFKKSRLQKTVLATMAIALIAIAVPATATAGVFEEVNAAAANGKLVVHSLRGNISELDGSGGNITVLNGPDGQWGHFLVAPDGFAKSVYNSL